MCGSVADKLDVLFSQGGVARVKCPRCGTVIAWSIDLHVRNRTVQNCRLALPRSDTSTFSQINVVRFPYNTGDPVRRLGYCDGQWNSIGPTAVGNSEKEVARL